MYREGNKRRLRLRWRWWQRAVVGPHFQYGSFVGRGAEVKETHKTCVVGTNLKKKPAAGEVKFFVKAKS